MFMSKILEKLLQVFDLYISFETTFPQQKLIKKKS